ncbi:MAG: hypothetical protein GY778_21350 [bacterium]|nr:hypothetical protein [bacterium]
MKEFWSSFKRFWQAEEVPRWIGMSLVLIFAFGLGMVGWTAVTRTNEKGRAALQSRTSAAIGLLGQVLAEMDPENVPAQQVALRRFSLEFECRQLRVVNRSRQVVASVRSEELGGPNPFDPKVGTLLPRQVEIVALSDRHTGPDRYVFRAPVGADQAVPQRYLEGTLASFGADLDGLTAFAGSLLVILVTCGALFLLYRQMRTHFRGMARIASNLTAHPDELAEQLDSLRVADSLGSVARAWNRLIGTIEELQDHARRATASDELRHALERSSGSELAEALHALPDGVLFITEGQTVRYSNSMAARLLGINRTGDDQADGDRPADVILDTLETSPFGGRLVGVIRQACRADGSFEAHHELLEDPDTASTYRVRILAPRTHQAGECVAVVTDISQQVRADRAREDFVSQVTHELRTPLTNIRAYAETLSSGMFEDPKVITECYNVITKETRRLSRLIEDILSISQMEVGSIQLVEDDVDVRELLSDAVRDVRGLADEKKIDLQMNLPSKLGTVRADRDKLAVVINNLLGNALKYTPADGSVRLGCKMSETELVITVKDNGIGIDPANHNRVFEKFQRIQDPDVEDQVGTGIGLTTAREIVRRHQGDIELMSAKGEGSTFVVKIPLTAAASLATAGSS